MALLFPTPDAPSGFAHAQFTTPHATAHTQAELMELRAPLSGRASASVVEARIDVGLGPVATVIVKKGTLKVG